MRHDLRRARKHDRQDGVGMSFLLFLRGMLVALVVFAVTTYYVTQSLWTTLIQTVTCAVLLQVGYFAAVLFLVWRSGGQGDKATSAPRIEEAEAALKEEQSTTKAGQLPGVPRSR
jgi:exopolysaccharide production repressor protein